MKFTGKERKMYVLALVLLAVLGGSVFNMVLTLTIVSVPGFVLHIRAVVLGVVEQDYVKAARISGTKPVKLVLKHILPNGIGPIIVSATLCLGQTILSISSMGYLGLGVASPTPEWGTIISENKINIQAYPYLGLIPGICICLTVMAVNFIGDGLRDAFDPRTKK